MMRLFGRAPQLSRAREMARRAVTGEGSLLLLTGEPGIGKSHLADAIANVAAGAGATVAWGRSWEAGGAPTFWPWIEIFRTLGIPDDLLARVDTAHGDGLEARFRVLDVATETIARHAERNPLTLVLDDLHVADRSSLLLLNLLARRLGRLPVLVIGTYREVEARADRELAAILSKVAREGEVHALPRLSRRDMADWLEAALPQPAEHLVDEIERLTEGNPLFVQEVLRLGTDAVARRLPDTLTAVLEQHLSYLSSASRDLMRQAAVLGREVTPSVLAELTGLAPHEVEAGLEEAAELSIVHRDLRRGYRFAHVLLRERLYAELEPQRRAEQHWRLGEVLVRSRAPRHAEAHQTGVHHLLEGVSAGVVGRAAEEACFAAKRSLTRLAFEDATDLARRALGMLPEHGESSRELRLVEAESLMRGGETDEARRACIDIARRARSDGHAEVLARAALIYGTYLASATVDSAMVELLGDALDALPEGDSLLRARLSARYAAALIPLRHPADAERVLALARSARAMAERVDDPATRLYVAYFSASAAGYLVARDERFALGEEIVTLARALDDRATLAVMTGWHIVCLVEQGRRADAVATLRAYEVLMEDFRQPQHRWRLALSQALFAALDGDLAGATALTEQMHALAREAGPGPGLVAWAIHRIALAHAFGDVSSLASCSDELMAVTGRAPPLRIFHALVLISSGRLREARAIVAAACAGADGYPLLIAAAHAAVLLADADLVRELYPRLAQHELHNRFFWGPAGAFALGPTARTLGDMARLMGERGAARSHYERALAHCAEAGIEPLAKLTRAALASLDGAVVSRSEPLSLRPTLSLTQEGELWTLRASTGPAVTMKHAKGLVYLSYLLGQPGRRIHVLELAGVGEPAGDAGPVLDHRAKAEYRRRLQDLAAELEEAESFGDAARACRAREEIDALAEQLAWAVGLGGRDRRAASNVERARVNVQRRLKDSLRRIARIDPALGRYLTVAIHTGTFCSYEPI